MASQNFSGNMLIRTLYVDPVGGDVLAAHVGYPQRDRIPELAAERGDCSGYLRLAPFRQRQGEGDR